MHEERHPHVPCFLLKCCLLFCFSPFRFLQRSMAATLQDHQSPSDPVSWAILLSAVCLWDHLPA